jgi:hypothetical protein
MKIAASGNAIFTGGSRITASGNGDFHWPLALAALKNASANISRTATIEPLCTSVKYEFGFLFQTKCTTIIQHDAIIYFLFIPFIQMLLNIYNSI